MSKLVNIPAAKLANDYNETFTLAQHMEFIYKLFDKSWRLILRYENPSNQNKKVKHPSLKDLSEDDLKRKLVLNVGQRLDTMDHSSTLYTIAADESLSDAEPDIVINVRCQDYSAILDIECKKSKNDSNSAKQYSSQGVQRFIDGKYDKGNYGIGGMISFAITTNSSPLHKVVNMLRDASNVSRTDIDPQYPDGSVDFLTIHVCSNNGEKITLRHKVLHFS